MNRWKVTAMLKNGMVIRGIFITEAEDGKEVLREVMPGVEKNIICPLMSEENEGKEMLCFMTSEVAALKIEVPE